MKLRNKKTGEIGTPRIAYQEIYIDTENKMTYYYKSLQEVFEEWEDYKKQKEYKYVLPNKVRRAILSWVKAQDNPIEKISILLKSYYDTHEVDSDGFYDYEFYGYVGGNNKNLVANTLSIRLKEPFVFNENRDYTLPELGIIGIFGGKE